MRRLISHLFAESTISIGHGGSWGTGLWTVTSRVFGRVRYRDGPTADFVGLTLERVAAMRQHLKR